jgi:hypothetical protein
LIKDFDVFGWNAQILLDNEGCESFLVAAEHPNRFALAG